MSIKPTRNELLDAIANKIAILAGEAAQEVKDVQCKVRSKLDLLRSKRSDKQLKAERFEPVKDEIETALNTLLKKHGFDKTYVQIKANSPSEQSPEVRVRLEFRDVNGRSYKKTPTKVFDRQILAATAEYAELEDQLRQLDKRYQQFASGGRYERNEDRKRRRDAIVSQILESDKTLIESIDKAAKGLTADVDEIVAAAMTHQPKEKVN